MESPSAFKEIAAGMLDGGEVSIECNFLMDGTQDVTAGILLDWTNRTKRNFQIAWVTPTAETIQFAAFVTRYTPKTPAADVMTVDITLKLTGAVSWP